MTHQLSDFLKYITSDGKHGFYQLFPPALINKFPDLKKLPYDTIRLDDKRYDYITKSIDVKGLRVTDIGANIGYFSFRLATEMHCEVLMYEPYKDHFKAIKEIKSMLNLNDKMVRVENMGIDLNGIDNIEPTDLILLFNVLQHAGEDFDKDKVTLIHDWYGYAKEYLLKLRKKTTCLVFQTGYSWLGHNKELCSKEKIIEFTQTLLEESGWQILKCGIVTNYESHVYRDFDFEKSFSNPIFNPLKYIEYGVKYRLGFNVPNFRFIQRPIFICKSNKLD